MTKNFVELIGFAGKAPKRIGDKGPMKLSIATTDRWRDSSGEWQERTEWHTVLFWGRLAGVVGQHVEEGCHVLVTGSPAFTPVHEQREPTAHGLGDTRARPLAPRRAHPQREQRRRNAHQGANPDRLTARLQEEVPSRGAPPGPFLQQQTLCFKYRDLPVHSAPAPLRKPPSMDIRPLPPLRGAKGLYTPRRHSRSPGPGATATTS